MPVTSHQVIADIRLQGNGLRRVKFVFTLSTGAQIRTVPRRLPAGDNYDTFALLLYMDMDEQLAKQEVSDAVAQAELGQNPDKVPPDHQTQAEFDRRVLGRMMLTDDVHAFYATYPMFQAVELRGGANANQRATYLGITVAEYNLIAERFNNVSGVAWFLDDEKGQRWTDLPEAFE